MTRKKPVQFRINLLPDVSYPVKFTRMRQFAKVNDRWKEFLFVVDHFDRVVRCYWKLRPHFANFGPALERAARTDLPKELRERAGKFDRFSEFGGIDGEKGADGRNVR